MCVCVCVTKGEWVNDMIGHRLALRAWDACTACSARAMFAEEYAEELHNVSSLVDVDASLFDRRNLRLAPPSLAVLRIDQLTLGKVHAAVSLGLPPAVLDEVHLQLSLALN